MNDIKILNFKNKEHKAIKATFTVCLNDVCMIHNCKLVYSEKTNKYYVFFPSFTYKDKSYSYVKFSDSLHQEVVEKVTQIYNSIG